MNKQSCLGCFGATICVVGICLFALGHGLRTYRHYDEYPSPTHFGNLIVVESADLSDVHYINCIINPAYRNGKPFRITKQNWFDSLQWSKDGSVLVIDDKYVYDFRSNMEITFPTPSVASKKKIQHLLRKNGGGGGYKFDYTGDLPNPHPELVAPRRHTIWFWQQNYWMQQENQ
jgi:hypothetical protein